MAGATDFKTSDKTTNSLFKGAGFNKSEPEAKPAYRQRQNSGGIDFENLSDDLKQAYHYLATDARFIPNVQDAGKWAKQAAASTGINPKALLQAAKQMEKDSQTTDNPYKYPWWSAARDWNPEAVGQLGQKMNSSLKPSQDLLAGIQSGPRMW